MHSGVRPVTSYRARRYRNAALSLRRIIQTAQIGSQGIRGAPDTTTPFIENVRGDHDRLDVLVAEELLHRPDVRARFQ